MKRRLHEILNQPGNLHLVKPGEERIIMANKSHPQPQPPTGAGADTATLIFPQPTLAPPETSADKSDPADPKPAAQISWPDDVSPFDRDGQFKRLLTQFEHYASFDCCPPQDQRDGIHFEHLDDPYVGTYPESKLPIEQEHRMRQSFELQAWLALDASSHFSMVAGQLPPEGSTEFFGTPPEQFRTSFLQGQLLLTQKKRDALISLQSVLLSRLRAHSDLTGALFESLRLEVPTTASTTKLPSDCLELMAKASIEEPVNMNALGLYKVLAKQLQAQERELFAVNLELLRDELHTARMGFYLQAGQYLKGQAQTILAAYDESATKAPLLDEHGAHDELYEHLKEVVDEPIYTLWPAPVQPESVEFMGRPGTF